MSWFTEHDPEAPQRLGGGVGAPSPTTGAGGYTRNPDGSITYNGYNPNTGVVSGTPSVSLQPGESAAKLTGDLGAASATTPPASGDPVTQFNAILAKHPGDPQAAIDEWNASGDPGGLKPAWEPGSKTIGLANGTYLVQPGTGGNTSGSDWATVQRQPGDTGQSSSAATPLSSDLLAPYTKTFDYAPFSAPTNVTEQNDPGFQSRLQLGQQALERSAAGRGTLLTGGTAKDLAQFGQNYASNEYQNVYGRAAQDYNTNRNNAYQQYLGDQSTFYANQNNPFAKLLSLSALDQQGQIANGQLGLGYANLNASNINAGNLLNFDYTQLGANNLNQGANAYGNYTTGAGNAAAAGTVGGANAWQNAFGNIGNTALGLYYGSQLGRPPTVPQQPVPGVYGGY